MADIKPFTISIDAERLEDLKLRLSLARFPDELEEAGWDLGAPLSDVRRITEYWRKSYEWKTAEINLNKFPQFTTSIQADGFEPLNIHFVHMKSEVKGAIPLLFVHGWPGSFVEVTKILEPLTRGDGGVAFDVIAPSLPNFGFSEGTSKRGFGFAQYAETMNKLMLRLGYKEYVTQGGDWGAWITRAISLLYPGHCKATHFNMDMGRRPSYLKNPWQAFQHTTQPYNTREANGVDRSAWFNKEGYGYNHLQGSKPQTIGYALADSPVALLSWIYEKLHDWTDDYPWTDDEICTWTNIYWFSTAGPAASCRIYYESRHIWKDELNKAPHDILLKWIPNVKIGYSHFPQDIYVIPSTWTRTLGSVVFEKEHESGGHFAAYERPDQLVGDLRSMFGRGGGAYDVVKGN
ncbi:microsomal epoxide hydrolase [Bisporella sp. PMI_857]|nr:microsomal epoxide hydrolase [Bisporella sp. PMI_857]